VSAAVKRRRKGAARGNLLAMKNNIKVVLGVINSKQIATYSFAMTSLVENIIKFERGVSSSRQINCVELRCAPVASLSFAMTSLVENNTIALGVNKRKQITTSFLLALSVIYTKTEKFVRFTKFW